MKRSRIILLSVLAALLVAGTIAVISTDAFAKRKINEQLAHFKSEQYLPVTWSGLHVYLLAGRVCVDSLTVSMALPDSLTGDTIFLDIHSPRVDVGPVNWITLLRKRVVHIDRARIKKTRIDLRRHSDQLHLHADSITVAVHDLSYNLRDSAFTYNDSVYLVKASHIALTAPDGLFNLRVGQLFTEDAGAIELQDIIGGHTCKREAFARINGKQPSTWAQFDVKRVRTSPVNIIRLALAQALDIESVEADLRSVEIYRDTQYPLKHPEPMPQEALMSMPLPMHIAKVNATLKQLDIAMTIDGEHSGALQIFRAKAAINDISNAAGNTMTATMDAELADRAKVHANAAFNNNKRCTFSYNAIAAHTTGANFRDLTKPMLGIEARINIHDLKASGKGDRKTMKGSFCMLYDSLAVHVDEQGPIAQLQKYAGIVNAFAPAVILNRNPRMLNTAPQTVEMVVEHYPLQSFPVYMFGVLIDGLVMTVLPPTVSKPVLQRIKEAQKNPAAAKAAANSAQTKPAAAKTAIKPQPAKQRATKTKK